MFVGAVVVAAATAIDCGKDTQVDPSPTCASGFGPLVTGFEVVDRSGPGFGLRVGEITRLSLKVGRPRGNNSCEQSPRFVYMKWTWNYPRGTNFSREPTLGPIDVTIGSCRCTLFGEPQWNVGPTGGQPHWEQRAWLEGEQTLELEVRGVSVGGTSLSIVAFVGPPSSNPLIDNGTYQLHSLSVSVTQ